MYYLLIIIGVISRLVPHPANFTALGGLSVFAGRRFSLPKAVFLTLAVMVVSDIFLGFGPVTPYVYAGFAGYILLARILAKKWYILAAAPVLGSAWFFLISNFGVWLGGWYPHTLAGLTGCFVAAIPFYRNTLLGDVAFTIAFFALEAIYKKIVATKKEERWLRFSRPPILTKK